MLETSCHIYSFSAMEKEMTRVEFVRFLREFRKDLLENRSEWKNATLANFLEAMITYTEDVQGYYDNMALQIDANEPTWENFSVILRGAAVYE